MTCFVYGEVGEGFVGVGKCSPDGFRVGENRYTCGRPIYESFVC